MVQKQWRRWSDPFIEGNRQVRETRYCLFRERRRAYVLWHARVDEQHRSFFDNKGSEETAWQSESVQQALDHMPLLMELHHTFVHKGGQKTQRIAWTVDKLAAALQTENGRVEFLRIYKTRCRERKETSNTSRRNEHLTITGQPR